MGMGMGMGMGGNIHEVVAVVYAPHPTKHYQ